MGWCLSMWDKWYLALMVVACESPQTLPTLVMTQERGWWSSLRICADVSNAASWANADRLMANGLHGTIPVASKPETILLLVKSCLKAKCIIRKTVFF